MPPDDWRRTGQERYLTGATFFARRYRPRRPGWDHDHCEFCGAKFASNEGDLDSGYTTADEYRWVCARCFADFRDEFGWSVGVERPAGG